MILQNEENIPHKSRGHHIDQRLQLIEGSKWQILPILLLPIYQELHKLYASTFFNFSLFYQTQKIIELFHQKI